MDWTIATLLSLGGLTITVGTVVWRLAVALSEQRAAVKLLEAELHRAVGDARKLAQELSDLESGTDHAADEIRRTIAESAVTREHLLMQLQMLELRVLNELLERVIKLLNKGNNEGR